MGPRGWTGIVIGLIVDKIILCANKMLNYIYNMSLVQIICPLKRVPIYIRLLL